MKTKMLFLGLLLCAGFSVNVFSQCRTVTWYTGSTPCSGSIGGGVGSSIQVCMTFQLTGAACRVPPGSYTVCQTLSPSSTVGTFCPPAPAEPGCSVTITGITVQYGSPGTVPATGSSSGALVGAPFSDNCFYDWCQTGTNTYALVPFCLVGR